MTALPIVFAPGLMCDERLFHRQAAHFAPHREIFYPDFAKDNSIGAMAQRLLSDAPEIFFLAGLSMGAIVAFEAVRRAPTRIAGLALMNTTAFADSPARKKVRLNQIERVRDGALKTVVMEELKPNYLGAKTKKDEAVLQAIYDMAAALGPDVFERQSEALMARADSTDCLSHIACPTVIIGGEEDEVCPPEFHEVIHQGVAGSLLFVLPECGHLSTIEAPVAVNESLEAAIREAERAIA